MPGITNPGEEYFKDGLWGWDGAQWRKLALLFGYTDRYADQTVNTSAAAGTNALVLTTVPAGEVWVVFSIAAFDANSATTTILTGARLGAVEHYLTSKATPAASELVLWTGQIVLKAGDYLFGVFYGCTLNDDLYLTACGYKMKVT